MASRGLLSFATMLRLMRFRPLSPPVQNGQPFFFVTGRSRSGTTWMGRLLNSHPRIYCDITENAAFHQDFEFSYFSKQPHLLHDEARRFFDTRTWNLLKSGLIFRLLHGCDKPWAIRFGDKSPRQDVRRILEVFPEAHVIIMLRDFRDTCVSLAFHQMRLTGSWEGIFSSEKKESLDNDFIRSHMQNYEMHRDVENYLALSEEHPKQILLVRYEELHAETVDVLRRTLAFLGVDDSNEVADRSVKANSFRALSGGRDMGKEDAGSFFRKGTVGDWQNYFSDENKEVFKEASGNSLKIAGYENQSNW